jgi:hypothetical protein
MNEEGTTPQAAFLDTKEYRRFAEYSPSLKEGEIVILLMAVLPWLETASM